MPKLVARSPMYQQLGGVYSGSGSVRHKKHNSLDASPFRKRVSGQHSFVSTSATAASPGRITGSRNGSGSCLGIFRTASHQEDTSRSVVS
ncbi:hypothetical protein IV203_030405 [Nitzschia inconspicua]|nr:hypothetical protein IV203_028290 [Nitzschia inconspicua]KAG7362627.1 hypothetical protein IV203_025511 [Nitzschia inconspicua]KAG7367734.1 hypothetical protein IV203_030405 [Nitzschia inconspicua]